MAIRTSFLSHLGEWRHCSEEAPLSLFWTGDRGWRGHHGQCDQYCRHQCQPLLVHRLSHLLSEIRSTKSGVSGHGICLVFLLLWVRRWRRRRLSCFLFSSEFCSWDLVVGSDGVDKCQCQWLFGWLQPFVCLYVNCPIQLLYLAFHCSVFSQHVDHVEHLEKNEKDDSSFDVSSLIWSHEWRHFEDLLASWTSKDQDDDEDDHEEEETTIGRHWPREPHVLSTWFSLFVSSTFDERQREVFLGQCRRFIQSPRFTDDDNFHKGSSSFVRHTVRSFSSSPVDAHRHSF